MKGEKVREAVTSITVESKATPRKVVTLWNDGALSVDIDGVTVLDQPMFLFDMWGPFFACIQRYEGTYPIERYQKQVQAAIAVLKKGG